MIWITIQPRITARIHPRTAARILPRIRRRTAARILQRTAIRITNVVLQQRILNRKNKRSLCRRVFPVWVLFVRFAGYTGQAKPAF